MLKAEHLTKRFNGVAAVDDLSLTVGAGEVFALLGPNGAGKTTTINCFLGFIPPDGGRVLFDGLDVASHALKTSGCSPAFPSRSISSLARLETLDEEKRLHSLYHPGSGWLRIACHAEPNQC